MAYNFQGNYPHKIMYVNRPHIPIRPFEREPSPDRRPDKASRPRKNKKTLLFSQNPSQHEAMRMVEIKQVQQFQKQMKEIEKKMNHQEQVIRQHLKEQERQRDNVYESLQALSKGRDRLDQAVKSCSDQLQEAKTRVKMASGSTSEKTRKSEQSREVKLSMRLQELQDSPDEASAFRKELKKRWREYQTRIQQGEEKLPPLMDNLKRCRKNLEESTSHLRNLYLFKTPVPEHLKGPSPEALKKKLKEMREFLASVQAFTQSQLRINRLTRLSEDDALEELSKTPPQARKELSVRTHKEARPYLQSISNRFQVISQNLQQKTRKCLRDHEALKSQISSQEGTMKKNLKLLEEEKLNVSKLERQISDCQKQIERHRKEPRTSDKSKKEFHKRQMQTLQRKLQEYEADKSRAEKSRLVLTDIMVKSMEWMEHAPKGILDIRLRLALCRWGRNMVDLHLEFVSKLFEPPADVDKTTGERNWNKIFHALRIFGDKMVALHKMLPIKEMSATSSRSQIPVKDSHSLIISPAHSRRHQQRCVEEQREEGTVEVPAMLQREFGCGPKLRWDMKLPD